MKTKKYFLIALCLITFIYACKKDKVVAVAPDISLNIKTAQVAGKVNAKITFIATSNNDETYQQEWKLDGAVVSTANSYDFLPLQSGTYVVEYKATNSVGVFTYKYEVAVAVPTTDVTPTSSKYISKIFEYAPAPGQFINEVAIGSPAQAEKLIGSITNMVSLGGFGGYVVFGFDHSVVNQAGSDLAIYGNPAGAPYHFSEPGIVMVSQDKNGNGLADDEWYELAGSEYAKTTTIKNYEITYTNPKAFANVSWKDNQGKTGVVEVNTFHRHNFYPEFAKNQETLTFKGTLLPSTVSSSGIITSSPFEWGYTDSYALGDDYDTKKYNSFDISWAVDKNGAKVDLKTVDFIKVYTAQNVNAGSLGEISTEVKGAVDLGVK